MDHALAQEALETGQAFRVDVAGDGGPSTHDEGGQLVRSEVMAGGCQDLRCRHGVDQLAVVATVGFRSADERVFDQIAGGFLGRVEGLLLTGDELALDDRELLRMGWGGAQAFDLFED
ncbi:MAG: hypothetical protein O7A04_09970, partial [Acidobacteria bacterium]|nr:hypothetical protein [Acidobacteriota bacterium]